MTPEQRDQLKLQAAARELEEVAAELEAQRGDSGQHLFLDPVELETWLRRRADGLRTIAASGDDFAAIRNLHRHRLPIRVEFRPVGPPLEAERVRLAIHCAGGAVHEHWVDLPECEDAEALLLSHAIKITQDGVHLRFEAGSGFVPGREVWKVTW